MENNYLKCNLSMHSNKFIKMLCSTKWSDWKMHKEKNKEGFRLCKSSWFLKEWHERMFIKETKLFSG